MTDVSEIKRRVDLNDIVGLQQAAGMMLSLASNVSAAAQAFSSASQKHQRVMSDRGWVTMKFSSGDEITVSNQVDTEKLRHLALEMLNTELIRHRVTLDNILKQAVV